MLVLSTRPDDCAYSSARASFFAVLCACASEVAVFLCLYLCFYHAMVYAIAPAEARNFMFGFAMALAFACT